MVSTTSKSKKSFLAFLVFCVLIGAPLISQGASAIVYVTKEFGLDLVARLIAQNILGSSSKDAVDLIKNSTRDFGEDAGLIRNWRDFITKSNQRGENIFRAQIAYVSKQGILCAGSRTVLDQIFRGTGTTPAKTIQEIGSRGSSLRINNFDNFQTRVKCTIPDNVLSNFERDFQQGGGWETWSRLVEPQNNIYGLTAMSLSELEAQRSVEEKADESETRSSGFLPRRPPCDFKGENSRCTFFGEIVTPKQIMETAGIKTVDSSWNWLTTSDELSEVIAAVINAAFQKLNQFIAAKTGGVVNIGGLSEAAVSQQAQADAAKAEASQARLQDIAALQRICINDCIAREQLSCSSIQDPATKQACLNSAVLRCNATPGPCR